MMLRTLAALALLALAACSPSEPPAYRAAKLEIGQPWSRPAAAGMNGAGYLTIANKGSSPDRLVAVESPIAGRVEIHEGSTKDGMMRMGQMKAGLALPAGKSAAFEPGANHLMLIGLTAPLVAGDRFPAVLVFETAGRVPVQFEVRAGASEHSH